MIVSLKQFEKGIYRIPGALKAPNGDDRSDTILEYIEKFEKDILIDGLGILLYKEVVDSFELTNGVYTLKATATQAIKDLVNGVTYTNEGLEVQWEGLEPLLVPYVYAEYLANTQDILTNLGVKMPDAINTENVSAQPRYAKAYREFYKRYLNEDAEPRVLHRSAGIGIDWYGSRNTNISLYEFLITKDSDYPNAVFTYKENTNSFGV